VDLVKRGLRRPRTQTIGIETGEERRESPIKDRYRQIRGRKTRPLGRLRVHQSLLSTSGSRQLPFAGRQPVGRRPSFGGLPPTPPRSTFFRAKE